MVAHTIQTVRANLPVSLVHASRGKQARAEPVAALYEQGKVSHVGVFAELEDQMATWEPLSGMPSPDRLDALVWGLTELAIGGGPRVFTASESDFVVAGVRIASSWRRVVAVDADRSRFTAIWGAWDRTNDVVYLYDEYTNAEGSLPVLAQAIKKRGPWIPSLIDMEARGRSKAEGIALVNRLLDLEVEPCTVPFDLAAGIDEARHRLATGRLKAFSNCERWLSELRRYCFDEDEQLPGRDDHLMQATALLCQFGQQVASISSSSDVSSRTFVAIISRPTTRRPRRSPPHG